MRGDIRRFVEEWDDCQTIEHETLPPAGLLQPLPMLVLLWIDISMDFIEGLLLSHESSMIFYVIDRLTKHARFFELAHPYTTMRVA